MTRFLITLLLIIGAAPVWGAQTAEQILGRCAEKLTAQPSVTIKFSLAFGDKKSNCELIIAGDKYRLSSPDVEIWYDGSNQWSYSATDREVSITEPTEDEQMECNPFAILRNYKKAYDVRVVAGGKNEVELVAKSKVSNIRKAVVTINPSTDMPSKLLVTMQNGRTFTATVTSATIGKVLPASVFTYDMSKYPAATVNDLR